MLPQPYIYAAVAAALLLGGFFTGVKVTNNARDAKQLKAERHYQEQVAAETARANNLAQKYEEARTHIKDKFRTITKEVEVIIDRPVYNQCKLDADGLRLWNDANDGPGD